MVAVFDRPAGRATRPSRLSKLPAAAWDSSSFLWVRSELCCLDEVIEQNRGTGVLSAAATATVTASVLADSSAAAEDLALLQKTSGDVDGHTRSSDNTRCLHSPAVAAYARVYECAEFVPSGHGVGERCCCSNAVVLTDASAAADAPAKCKQKLETASVVDEACFCEAALKNVRCCFEKGTDGCRWSCRFRRP